jgi:mannose-6-phosphate isomerase-like protein (cupin superfamily)
MDRQMPPNVSFLSGRDTAPAYWMYNILWVPLIEGHQTRGSFSVIEQWMRKDSGALVPHVHNFCDEWFYMIDGTIEFTVSGEKLPAKAGENVWVARGTVHSFVVTSDVCHVLNGYTPGGFEQVIKHLAKPAERRELPPDTRFMSWKPSSKPSASWTQTRSSASRQFSIRGRSMPQGCNRAAASR